PAKTVDNQRITVDRILPKGNHYTSGASLESRWKTGTHHHLIAGVDLWQRILRTSREKEITREILDDFQNVQQTLRIVRGEKPTPDSRFGSAGVFIQHESKLMNDRLQVNVGFRTDLIRVQNDEAFDPVFLLVNGVAKEPVPGQRHVFDAQIQNAITWSAHTGTIFHLTPDLDISGTLGRSFRSPSLEERFKYIDLGSKVRLGNPQLKPEKGLFGDLSLKYWKTRLQIQLNGYIHYLSDMIVEQPGQFVFHLTSGEAAISDTLPALVNTNVDRALLYGAEWIINYQAGNYLVVFSKGSIVMGQDIYNHTFLPLIPPVNGALGVRYQLPGIFNLEWTTRAYAPQRRIAAGEEATRGYILSDFAIYSFPKQIGPAGFRLYAGVDNLFNKSYRNHLATNRGIIRAEPGRNLYIRLTMQF
ncbi:MAG: TonB-dependent receptor, partial [Bacteroidales bacterium]|nr:TonB-dependent receptor [Bacteroidales bacterium]